MSVARIVFIAAALICAAGCSSGPGDDPESRDPANVSPAVASLRQWASLDDSTGFVAAMRDSLRPGSPVMGGQNHFGSRGVGRTGHLFDDSTVVLLQLSTTSWDSAMTAAVSITDDFLDALAPGGEPLDLRAMDPLPMGGARWRWLTGDRVGELRLTGAPSPGWPRNALWTVSIAVTDRPAAAYDRGARAREVREVSRVARWFGGLMERGSGGGSPLVRWALEAGAVSTGMDGHTSSVEGGRFAEDRTLHEQLELQLESGSLAPDSLARALARRVEPGLADALGAHGRITRSEGARWEFEGRGRAGHVALEVRRDPAGRCWLDLRLLDGPAGER